MSELGDSSDSCKSGGGSVLSRLSSEVVTRGENLVGIVLSTAGMFAS